MSTKTGWLKDKNGKKFAPKTLSSRVIMSNGTNLQDTLDNLETGGSEEPINLLDKIYPVGSIYMSVNNVSPATFLGGTWEAIQDRFLIGAGNSYDGGAIGGSTSVTSEGSSAANTGSSSPGTGASSAANTGSTTLTVNQIPSHTHTVTTANFAKATANDGSDCGVLSGSSSKTSGSTGGGQGHTHSMAHTHTVNSHSHTMAHTHSVSTMSPYLAVYMWKRTS